MDTAVKTQPVTTTTLSAHSRGLNAPASQFFHHPLTTGHKEIHSFHIPPELERFHVPHNLVRIPEVSLLIPAMVAFPAAAKALSHHQTPHHQQPNTINNVTYSHKTPLENSSPWHPKNWNLKKLMPPLGFFSTVAWGLGSIFQHHIEDGHLPHSKLLPKLMNPIMTKLAVAAPVMNIIYGGLSALVAYSSGYSLRGVAFTSFTLFSLLCAPMMMRNTSLSLKVANMLKNGVAKDAPELIALAKKGLITSRWVSAFNAIAPIGLLAGMFSMTKVAQSRPGVKLDHVEGTTFAEMTQKTASGKDMAAVFKRNAKTEWDSFKTIMVQTPQNIMDALRATGRGFKHLFQKPDAKASDNPFSRFSDSMVNSNATPLFYAHAASGRMLSSALAVGALALSLVSLNRKSVLFHEIVKPQTLEGAKKTTVNALKKALNVALFWGQLAGVPAALFTAFNDWNPILSSVYRFSGPAYGVSAFLALKSVANLKKLGRRAYPDTVFGLDAGAWTKVGVLIQSSMYFANLYLQGLKKKSKTSADSHKPLSMAKSALTLSNTMPSIVPKTKLAHV